MTEITRVPLQPIAKGALGKLWLGVAAAALAAGGLAWATLPKGVDVEVIKAGTGPSPTVADVVQINYKGMLENGKVFDQAERAVFPVEGRRGTTLEVRVHPEDIGKVIGRNGRTAKALRTVVSALAGRSVRVDLIEADEAR